MGTPERVRHCLCMTSGELLEQLKLLRTRLSEEPAGGVQSQRSQVSRWVGALCMETSKPALFYAQSKQPMAGAEQ